MSTNASLQRGQYGYHSKAKLKTHQKENFINQGFKTMGRSMWLPTTIAKGRTIAQFHPSILHSNGTNWLFITMIMTIIKVHTESVNQNRLKIRGASIKNVDFSTSFPVEPHVMS